MSGKDKCALLFLYIYATLGPGGKKADVAAPVYPRDDKPVRSAELPYYWESDMDELLCCGLNTAMNFKVVAPKDPVILMTGWKNGAGFANTIRIVNCPESKDMNLSSSRVPKLGLYLDEN